MTSRSQIARLLCTPVLAIAMLQPACGMAATDWFERSGDASMPVRPFDGAKVEQANPDFSWPMRKATLAYTIEISDASTGEKRVAANTSGNWFTPSQPLSVGRYRWRVMAPDGEWSRSREFSVSDAAVPMQWPDWGAVFEAIARQPKPRSFPQGAEGSALQRLLVGERALALRKMAERVRRSASRPLPTDVTKAVGGTERERAKALLALPQQLNADFQQIEEASILWLVSRDLTYQEEGRRRVLALARLDPDGSTAYEPTHHAPRNLLWALVIGYDRFHGSWTAAERSLLLRVIDRRLVQIETSLDGPNHLLRVQPYDSHGWVALHGLAGMLSVVGPELPEGDARFRRWVPWALGFIGPWGGEDGGYANGTAYATWNLEIILRYWDAIRLATGVDIYAKPSVRNLARFFAYFLPPGSTTHAFGEGAERRPVRYFIAAIASRVTSPEARWLRSRVASEDASNALNVVALPTDDGGGSIGASSYWSRSTGWVAMHSDLESVDRVSVYFKSSWFGSFVHSHADQNSFVLQRAGKPVLIDSGYYDWYGSPHRNAWYQTTKAHNAVTMDGGVGQKTSSILAKGSIVSFADQGDVAYVTGSAASAYGSALRLADRTMIYMRPNDLVVIDVIASDTPRSWEWNFHAAGPITDAGYGLARVKGPDGDACVRSIGGGPRAYDLKVTNAFPIPPDGAPDVVPQWHAAFVSRTASLKELLVHHVSADCGHARKLSWMSVDGGFVLKDVDSGLGVRVDAAGRVIDVMRGR